MKIDQFGLSLPDDYIKMLDAINNVNNFCQQHDIKNVNGNFLLHMTADEIRQHEAEIRIKATLCNDDRIYSDLDYINSFNRKENGREEIQK